MRKVAETIGGLLLLIFIAVLLVIVATANPHKNIIKIEKTSLKDAILLDAASRFPSADKIGIVNVISRNGSKVVVVKLVYNYSSLCPKRYHVYYTYPEGRFLPEAPVLTTLNCNLCKDKNCTIAYEEDAIIASVNVPGSEEVRSFVMRGHPEVQVEKTEYGWKVIWYNDEKAYIVEMDNEGSLINISKLNETESLERKSSNGVV